METTTKPRRRWMLRGTLLGVSALVAGVIAVNAVDSDDDSALGDTELARVTGNTIAVVEGDGRCGVAGTVEFIDAGSELRDGDDIFVIHDLCRDGFGIRMDLRDVTNNRFLETVYNGNGGDVDDPPKILDADIPADTTFELTLFAVDRNAPGVEGDVKEGAADSTTVAES